MLTAALSLYANGKKLPVPAAEVWGELQVGKDRQSGIYTAQMIRFGSTAPHSELLPVLYDPTIRLVAKDRLDLRGMERIEDAWYLQLWSCRVLSRMELVLGSREHGLVALKGAEAVYLRCWERLCAHAAEHSTGKNMDIGQAVKVLEMPVQEIYPLVEWAARTQRCFTVHGGDDELGVICFKSLGVEMAVPQSAITQQGTELTL